MKVTACLVTRGDVDMQLTLDSIPQRWERIVWVNGARRRTWKLITFPPGAEAHWWGGGKKEESFDVPVELQRDLGVYGRYAAMKYATGDVIYVQDDDCILPPESFEALAAAYTPGALVANMPEPFRAHYTDSSLVGFGAIFDRDLPSQAWAKLPYPVDAMPVGFRNTCDVYFTTLVEKTIWVDVPYENLPWATAETRMYRQADHVGTRAKALEHARSLR